MLAKTSKILRNTLAHLLACLDGKAHMPHWLHRSHRLGHIAYYGSMAFGFTHFHEVTVPLVFAFEALSLIVGRKS